MPVNFKILTEFFILPPFHVFWLTLGYVIKPPSMFISLHQHPFLVIKATSSSLLIFKIEKTLKIALKLPESPYFSTFWINIFLKSNIRPYKIFLKSNNLCTKKSVVPTIFLKSRFFLKSGFLKSRFHCMGNICNICKKMASSSQLILSLILKQGQRLGGEFQKA